MSKKINIIINIILWSTIIAILFFDSYLKSDISNSIIQNKLKDEDANTIQVAIGFSNVMRYLFTILSVSFFLGLATVIHRILKPFIDKKYIATIRKNIFLVTGVSLLVYIGIRIII